MKKTLGMLVAVTAILGFAAIAGAKDNMTSPAPAAAAPSTMTPADTERLNRKASTAQMRVQRSHAQMKALVTAVKANNTDEARKILLKNGFTKKDLEGAKISLVDNTGGASEPAAIKIKSITIKCCPLEIIITIEL